MNVFIGTDCLYNNEIHHVQDTDFIRGIAKIGKSDVNGIVWNPFWVPFEEIRKLPH